MWVLRQVKTSPFARYGSEDCPSFFCHRKTFINNCVHLNKASLQIVCQLHKDVPARGWEYRDWFSIFFRTMGQNVLKVNINVQKYLFLVVYLDFGSTTKSLHRATQKFGWQYLLDLESGWKKFVNDIWMGKYVSYSPSRNYKSLLYFYWTNGSFFTRQLPFISQANGTYLNSFYRKYRTWMYSFNMRWESFDEPPEKKVP